MSKAALDYSKNHQSDYLAALKDFLSIPSISTQSEHVADIQRAAEWLAARMTAGGLENVQIMPTGGHPAVYADWLHAENAPTVLIYGHYDVQPVDPIDLWDTPPFEPTVRNNYIFARGATDDKGQMFIHVAAVEAILATDGKLPVNVKFLLEGEEEIGSKNLENFIASHVDLLKADAALVSDTHILSPDQPSVAYGLRGLAILELEVKSASQDLHSGQYGGVIHNPLTALVEMLAKMHNENGTVTIPGFYDDVLPLSEEESAMLKAVPENYLAETGATKLWGEAEFHPNERTGARPTLEIHGIVGGYIGEGSKTVIPAGAFAKLSMRLVPNQDPEKVIQQFIDYVAQITPATVRTEVRQADRAAASIVDLNDPAIIAMSNAYELGFGKKPLFSREGGSIPVVLLFQKYLGLPVALMGVGLPDDNLHSPNEKFFLPNFYKGINSSIHFMDEYTKLKL